MIDNYCANQLKLGLIIFLASELQFLLEVKYSHTISTARGILAKGQLNHV